MGAITQVAQGTAYSEGQANGSLTLTDNTSGAKRCAVFTLHRFAGSGGEPPGCATLTYDGVDMMPVLEGVVSDSFACIYVYALMSHNLGAGAKTVSWTTVYANYAMWGVCTTFTNVKGWDDTIGVNSGNDAAPTLTDGALAAGELFLAAMTTKGAAITAGAGVTTVWNSGNYGVYSKTGSGSTAIANSCGSAYWGAAGITLTPAPAGGNPRWFFSKMQDFYRDLKAGLVPPDLLQQRYRDLVAI